MIKNFEMVFNNTYNLSKFPFKEQFIAKDLNNVLGKYILQSFVGLLIYYIMRLTNLKKMQEKESRI